MCFCTAEKKQDAWLSIVTNIPVCVCRKIQHKSTEAFFRLCFLPYSSISLRFSKSKHTSSDWVATVAAHPYPHLRCISLNLPVQKGTIKRPMKQMRFPYIRQPCNHISHVFSFPICYVLSKSEPESMVLHQEGRRAARHGPPSVSFAYMETLAPAEMSNLVHLQTKLQVETL